MAIVRLEALSQLRTRITCAVPALKDRVCVGQAPGSREIRWPSLAINPVRWSYVPDQALQHSAPAPDRAIMNVGRHEATVQLRLGASDLHTRMALEQEIVDLFLSTPLHPGVLLTDVVACPLEFTAAWELGEDEWRNELAFDKAYYSITTITGIIPALVTRLDAWTIDQLQLGSAVNDDFGDSTFGPPGVEVVRIAEDGTITPAP